MASVLSAGDLATVEQAGAPPRLRGLAEMTAAVGVQLAESSPAAQNEVQGVQRRERVFLGHEARVQNPAAGVAYHHHQAPVGQLSNPLVRRGIDVQEHARYGSAFAPTTIPTASWSFLRQSTRLQNVAGRRV